MEAVSALDHEGHVRTHLQRTLIGSGARVRPRRRHHRQLDFDALIADKSVDNNTLRANLHERGAVDANIKDLRGVDNTSLT